MALSKSEIKPPVLPKEAVQVDSLGGEVIVRGLMLAPRLALMANLGEDGRAYTQVSNVLAATVIDAMGLPIFTAEEWEAFGAAHFDDAMKLFSVASRLSGGDMAAAKKN